MHSLLLTAVLAGSGTGSGFETTAEAAAAVAPRVETGSLIFSRGDCLAVKVYTQSTYTHVAAVVVKDGEAFVYDATGGVGVRKQTLHYYLASQTPNEVHLFKPQRPIDGERAAEFEKALEGQLGRPYAIQHHLTGERCEGLHCAEYVVDALMAINVLHAERPQRVSPASLREGILKHDLYGPEETVQIARIEPPVEQGSNACEQLWIDTKLCCASCCRKMRGWFLCE
jgi:hypothetical protein